MNLPDNQEILRLRESVSLASFIDRLVASVTGAEVDCCCTMAVRGSENRFVQLSAGADSDICGEVVSNRYLSGAERWSPAEQRELARLGWLPPEPASVLLPDDSPSLNYRRDWRGVIGDERRLAIADLGQLLLSTLTELLGVTSPRQLEVSLAVDL